MQSIFLSHSFEDRHFATILAQRLRSRGIKVWLAEAEMRVGDSLIGRIEAAIRECSFLGVVLSPDSVSSPWVQREVRIALTEEICGERIKVLPLLHRRCDIPGFLVDKVYADFSADFERGLTLLLQRLAPDPVNAIVLSDGTEFSLDLETLTKAAGFTVRPLKDVRFPWEDLVPDTEGIVPQLIVVVRGEHADQKNNADLYDKFRRFVVGGGQLLATSWVCWEDLTFPALGHVLPAEHLTRMGQWRENEDILCRPTSSEMSKVFFPDAFALRTSFEVLRAKSTATVLLETNDGVPIVAYHSIGDHGVSCYLNSCQHWCGGSVPSPLRTSLPLRNGVAALCRWIRERC